MPILDLAGHRAATLLAALFLTIWGAAGIYRGLHTGFSGGLYDPAYRIPDVRPGSLAARSGFQPGDRVISVEGIPVEQLGMESRWPRSLVPRIGESRRFVVDRNGIREPIDVVYPAPFAAAANNRIGAAVMALAFLLTGLWACLTVPTRPARTLGYAGLASAAGAAFGLGPPLGSWNGVQHHAGTAAEGLMLILLLWFFVTFPAPKKVSGSRIAAGLVFGAWGCLLVFLVAELVLHPALYYTTGSVSGPLTFAYCLLILAAIAHTVVKTPWAGLRACGMHWILGALLVCMAGVGLTMVLPVTPPGWAYGLLIALIPLSMAAAVRRQAAS